MIKRDIYDQAGDPGLILGAGAIDEERYRLTHELADTRRALSAVSRERDMLRQQFEDYSRLIAGIFAAIVVALIVLVALGVLPALIARVLEAVWPA